MVFESRIFQRAKIKLALFLVHLTRHGDALVCSTPYKCPEDDPGEGACLHLEGLPGAGELVQQLRTHVAPPEDPDMLPSMLMELTSYNSSPRGSDALF